MSNIMWAYGSAQGFLLEPIVGLCASKRPNGRLAYQAKFLGKKVPLRILVDLPIGRCEVQNGHVYVAPVLQANYLLYVATENWQLEDRRALKVGLIGPHEVLLIPIKKLGVELTNNGNRYLVSRNQQGKFNVTIKT